jgi:hypothetical protein
MDFPRTSIAVTCVALLLRSAGVHGAESPMRQIVENTHRTQASVAVRQEYIEPLQLNGKTFRSALGILLEQGFRCAAKDGMAEIVRPDRRLPAWLDCRRDGIKVDQRCDLMFLGVSAADSQISTASQLARNLSEAKVGGITVFCAGKPDVTAKVRATFDQNRPAAEKKLAERMKALDAYGKTGADALLELLERGYSCGIESSDGSGKGAQPIRLVCAVRSLDAQHCVRERTQFELQPSTAAREGSATMDSLSDVVIRSQRSRCELTD